MAEVAQLQSILDQLRAQAGPRGATFAGRVLQPTDTPQSIAGRLPAGGVPGEEGLVAPVAAIAGGSAFVEALKNVIKGLKGKFPSKILEDIIKREQALGKPPNPRDARLTPQQQEMMATKYRPGEVEKAVGMTRQAIPVPKDIPLSRRPDESVADWMKRLDERKPLPVPPYVSPGPTGELEAALAELQKMSDELARSTGARARGLETLTGAQETLRRQGKLPEKK